MVVQKISTNEIVDTLNFNQWITRKHSFYFFGRFGLVIEILTYRTSLSIFVEWQWILFDFSILVLKAIVDRVRRKSLHLIFKIAKPNIDVFSWKHKILDFMNCFPFYIYTIYIYISISIKCVKQTKDDG